MDWLAAVPGAEFLPESDIVRVQRERWARQAHYVATASEFYRAHFRRSRLTGRLEELAELPFTTKGMLRNDQAHAPPFGTYLAAEPRAISRVHRTSGTTGVAMNIVLSARDAQLTALVGARAQSAAGLGPGHRVVHCLNYQLWMGGYTDHATLEATGATVVPYGVGGSENLIRVIREIGVTAIHCTPSYPAVLERRIAETGSGLRPRDLGLKLGLFGGEAGLDSPGFRERLEETWGFKARNANYGLSDVLSNFAAQTELATDLHFVAADVLFAELIDPDTGELRPWREGEAGELVLTHLAKECQPLVRFRSGDVIVVTGTGAAGCGRTGFRFRVRGRADDMVVVRGLSLFPATVAGVVAKFRELSGEYRIVLAGPPPYDVLPLEVEMAEGRPAAPGLASAVEGAIKDELGATARVVVLPANSLPRTEGKTRRVVRSD